MFVRGGLILRVTQLLGSRAWLLEGPKRTEPYFLNSLVAALSETRSRGGGIQKRVDFTVYACGSWIPTDPQEATSAERGKRFTPNHMQDRFVTMAFSQICDATSSKNHANSMLPIPAVFKF